MKTSLSTLLNVHDRACQSVRHGLLSCLLAASFLATATAETDVSPTLSRLGSLVAVRSKDGTSIAVECAGTGPSLVIVHGGTGDRTRWTPLFPLFASHFTVCAMDRRGHGASSDSPDYSLQKEIEDVAAVADSRPGPVFVLGHSYGAVSALEAAFLTNKISKLVLYEPPLQELDHTAVAARMEKMIDSLMQCLPNRRLVVFEGQQHNAMDTIPQQFANSVTDFLQSTNSKEPTNPPQ